MSLSTTGRIIKVKRKEELVKVANKVRKSSEVFKYNHVRVQFSDGSEHHMLFTDDQIKRGIDRAKKILTELPKITWMRELWYEGLIDTGLADIQQVINSKNLPNTAKKYNHLRVNYEKQELHMLLTDNEIRIALQRAEKNLKYLPKVSWFSEAMD